jgi:hypothetical protein
MDLLEDLGLHKRLLKLTPRKYRGKEVTGFLCPLMQSSGTASCENGKVALHSVRGRELSSSATIIFLRTLLLVE